MITKPEEKALRARIEDKSLEHVSSEAGVAPLTIAKYLANLGVNRGSELLVEQYAATLVGKKSERSAG